MTVPVPAWLTPGQLVRHQRWRKSLRPLCLALCRSNQAAAEPMPLLHGDPEGSLCDSNLRHSPGRPSTGIPAGQAPFSLLWHRYECTGPNCPLLNAPYTSPGSAPHLGQAPSAHQAGSSLSLEFCSSSFLPKSLFTPKSLGMVPPLPP